jgi:hypothetical protein
VARYEDLFTEPQLEALREAEEAETRPDARERLYRLRRSCESGVIVARLAAVQDALQNAELAARVEHRGESLPLRSATSKVATLSDYEEREELGGAAMAVSAGLNEQRLELMRAAEELRAKLSGEPDPIARAESEKQISLHQLVDVLAKASTRVSAAYEGLRTRWLDRLLGDARADRPSSYHGPFVLRLSPLADTYTKERATEVCVASLLELGFDLEGDSRIRTDLEDRPQKTPRPAVIAPDPPTVVYLITRPVGGLQDYRGFLHEAGHALHFAGCDPSLPYAFRRLARDNALTEVYSFAVQAVIRNPGWHERHFGLSADAALESAEATRFLDLFLFRRYLAKLLFELDFWSRFRTDGGTPEGYAEHLSEATGFVYPSERYLEDMDAGFYSADYVRAWIRSTQVRAYLHAEIGDEWWRSPSTADFLRPMFLEGTRPSNEDLAARLGYDPFDTEPLVAALVSN